MHEIFMKTAGSAHPPDAHRGRVRAGRVPPAHRVHSHGLRHTPAADPARYAVQEQSNQRTESNYSTCPLRRSDERGRLLRTRRAAQGVRRLRPVLHQCGHCVCSAGLCREIHPVQVHQVTRPKGHPLMIPRTSFHNSAFQYPGP